MVSPEPRCRRSLNRLNRTSSLCSSRAYAPLRSRYPLATFSSISPSAWRRASSSLANSLVLAWPSLPIRP